MRRAAVALTCLALAGAVLAAAQRPPAVASAAPAWVTVWAASPHGPYPSGNATAQPVLDGVFPSPATGAVDQTFRLVVKPDVWGAEVRVRFTNVFGRQAVTVDDVFIGLRATGAVVAAGTNVRVTFDGRPARTLSAGDSAWSDPVRLAFVTTAGAPYLEGRHLAVSFHVPAATGPMTWHAKALTTSYVTAPGAGSHGADTDDAAFAASTTSWYFVDALDVRAPPGTETVVAFGDSITDGTASTLNGDDRWPDVLSRRLHAAYGSRVAVVNAGIGGNQVLGPRPYRTEAPAPGGPAAIDRLERDVLSLSGVRSVIWLEGINDLSAGASADAIIAGLREGVARMRARGIRVIGGTITSSLGSTTPGGTTVADEARRAINAFIRTPGAFDGIADFDAATVDPATGALRTPFQPNSSTGGPGDRLHPNRAGYLAMGHAVEIGPLAPAARP